MTDKKKIPFCHKCNKFIEESEAKLQPPFHEYEHIHVGVYDCDGEVTWRLAPEEDNSPHRTTHAIVVPWPLSSGLHTWCGYALDNALVANDLVASAPGAVTCQTCIQSMKQAQKNLDEWVPELPIPMLPFPILPFEGEKP